MNQVLSCRRTFIALMSIMCLTGLGVFAGLEVSGAIATVALSVCAANATQRVLEGRKAPTP